MNEIFLSPRFVGERFNGHAIPLEFLRDLAVLEEMIVEVAKWVFLEQHKDRSRSPRGFTDGIELKLTEIGEGSAVPVISLCISSATLFPPDNVQYFEDARDSIISAVAAAEENEPITNYLPEKALVYFDRLGRSLRDGESIEFTDSKQHKKAHLTKETRRRLILASTEVKELTEETIIRGLVPEADQDKKSFQVQLVNGKKITAPLETQHLDTVLDAFNRYKEGARILLHGVGKYDRNNRLQNIDSIEHINILDPCDVSARLEELSLLKDGWLNGEGIAPSKAGLEWISVQFSAHYSDELSLPYIYPTAEGGVQAEWSLVSNEISLNIDLVDHKGAWHVLNLETDVDLSEELDLNDEKTWIYIADQIKKYSGATL